MTKILKASPYYLEDVLGLKLDERSPQSPYEPYSQSLWEGDNKISFLSLNQPPQCDAHCQRCFMPEARRELQTQDALTLDESKTVIEKAKEYGALCLEISGEGEPTLSKNLSEIIAHAHKLGYLTTLITNGHFLTPQKIAFYCENDVTLVFSHISLDADKYNADSGTKMFDHKMENLSSAIEIYRGTVQEENGFEVHRLGVHATLQRDNIGDILEIKKYCQEQGIFFSIAPLAQSGCALDHPELQLEKNFNFSFEEIYHIEDSEYLSRIEQKVEVKGQKISLFDVPQVLGDNSIIHSHSSARELHHEVCGTCYYGLNVGYDGSVMVDVHFGYEKNAFFNVKTSPYPQFLETRRNFIHWLFESMHGFCPVRHPTYNSKEGGFWNLFHPEKAIVLEDDGDKD